MDIELARTFLEIVNAGTFLKAAERLHVTQTTVTARIHSLESALGCTLFKRNRSGAKLTTQGEDFVEYATRLVHTWTLAKNRLQLPKGHRISLGLGAETSLWNPLLLHWVLWMQTNLPGVAVQSQVDGAAQLTGALGRGSLDAAILHRPNYYSGFTVELILEEKLIHVQASRYPQPDLFIDWGEDFVRQFDAALPHYRQSAYAFNLGQHALHVMLNGGGNGWFRTRVVEPYLASGELERVKGSPEFTYPVFLSYRSEAPQQELAQAIQGLKDITQSDSLWIV